MRPLRCSIRPGFQGRSKWKRSVQCAWKFNPSRAAVGGDQDAERIVRRVGVEAALNLLAVGAGGLAVDGLDPLVGQVGAGDGLLQHLAQVALRADHVLGEDQHPPGSLQLGRSGHRWSSIQRIRSRVLASGRPRAAEATFSIWSSRSCSARHSASTSGLLPDALSAAALMAAIWAASSAAFSWSVCSARSSSASGGRDEQGCGTGREGIACRRLRPGHPRTRSAPIAPGPSCDAG